MARQVNPWGKKLPRKKYQVEELKQCPIYTLPWPNYSSKHSWFSLHQTGDELKFPQPPPLKEMFSQLTPSLAQSQCWVSHSHPLAEQECQDSLTRWHSSDTSIQCIQWHPCEDLWEILTLLMTRLQKANIARQISVWSQTFKSPASCKKSKHLILLQQSFHTAQRSARNLFCCTYNLNIQSVTGQVSERFNE